MATRRTPLAWKNLVHDPRRLVLAASGVGFAAVLMFTQNGFRNALLDSPIQLIQMVDAPLVAVSKARYMLPATQQFDRDLLRRAAADPDVVEIQPLFIELYLARVRVEGQPSRPIRVIAVPMRRSNADFEPWLSIKGLEAQRDLLRRPGTALVDTKTRKPFGFARDESGRPTRQQVDLAGRPIDIVGSVSIGTDFANEGTLLVSEESFADYFQLRNRGQPLESVDLGFIRLRDGADVQSVAARLEGMAPKQWEVLPQATLMAREQDFWQDQTPVGMIFFIGTLMGFAVGVIICYQILYTSLQDAMPEFATLKAMGYPNGYFIGLVVKQSLFLSFFGFIPAVLVSWGLFHLLGSWSGLPMLLTIPRMAGVLGLTTGMCLISGLLAMRKLLRADPASLF
ncbi:MAG: FtsX-like permease family protein [Planctomycetota bacterium]